MNKFSRVLDFILCTLDFKTFQAMYKRSFRTFIHSSTLCTTTGTARRLKSSFSFQIAHPFFKYQLTKKEEEDDAFTYNLDLLLLLVHIYYSEFS